MCCIFTCCTWMVDLVQRCWTFTMSCCIGLAISCVMLSTSMAGIALGYNYSMAEYIDLKETNISVYVKRGVFDDEIADDFQFRRAGHMPVAGHLASDNLMTAPPDNTEPVRSGRRLDDSIVEADDPNKYEGSLMKLTARAPYPAPTPTMFDDGNALKELGKTFAPGSLDDLKALHYVINARKAAHPVNALPVKQATLANTDDRFMAHFRNAINSARRMDPSMINVNQLNPARFAVPDKDIQYPRDPERFLMMTPPVDELNSAITLPFHDRYASPIPVEPPPRRPPVWPTFSYPKTPMHTSTHAQERLETVRAGITAEPDRSMQAFKEKMMLDKFDETVRNEKPNEVGGQRQPDSDDYEEEIKGLPVRRRRRSIGHSLVNVKIEEALKANHSNNIHLQYVPDKIINNVLTNETTDVGAVYFTNISNNKKANTYEKENNINANDSDTSKINGTNTHFSVILCKLIESVTNLHSDFEFEANHKAKMPLKSKESEILNYLGTTTGLHKKFVSNDIKVNTVLKPYRNPSSNINNHNDIINEINSILSIFSSKLRSDEINSTTSDLGTNTMNKNVVSSTVTSLLIEV